MAPMFSKSLDECPFFLSGVRDKNENIRIALSICRMLSYLLWFFHLLKVSMVDMITLCFINEVNKAQGKQFSLRGGS